MARKQEGSTILQPPPHLPDALRALNPGDPVLVDMVMDAHTKATPNPARATPCTLERWGASGVWVNGPKGSYFANFVRLLAPEKTS